MRSALILCAMLALLGLAACSSPAPEAVTPDEAAVPTEPVPPVEPAVAAPETFACVTTDVCNEFTGVALPADWDARKVACEGSQGTWQVGACSAEKVVATCEKTDGAIATKMVCYAAAEACETACKDGGNFVKVQ